MPALTGKVALVTGASRGIGREIARLFAREGARVALHYHRSHAAAPHTLRNLDGRGHALFQADIGNVLQAEGLVPAVIRKLGRLDVLINNAGIYEMHPVLVTPAKTWLAVWRRTLRANLLGPALLSHAAAKAMAKRGGRIVNISSRGAFRGEPEAPAYGASKAGLNSLSHSMAKALAKDKIYVFAVAPGWVETDMAAGHLTAAVKRDIPLGRAATAQEVAETVLFLATRAPVSMTGAILDVNGASYLR